MSNPSSRPQYVGTRPHGDDSRHFSVEELQAAMRLVSTSEQEALEMVARLTRGSEPGTLPGYPYTDDTLVLIAVANAGASERVRALLEETAEGLAARVGAMRAALDLA